MTHEYGNNYDVANAKRIGERRWASVHKDRCPHGRFVSGTWTVTVDHDGPPTAEEWASSDLTDVKYGCRICSPPEGE